MPNNSLLNPDFRIISENLSITRCQDWFYVYIAQGYLDWFLPRSLQQEILRKLLFNLIQFSERKQ